MKKFRSTWIMALLVAAIGGYTAYEYRKAQDDAGLAEGERLAFTIKPNEVKLFKLIRGGEVVEVKNDKGNWQVLKPVDDAGDGPSIDGFLYPLLTQRLRQFKEGVEAAGAPANWAEYGLDPAAAVIEVSDEKKTETISISAKNAFDGSFYVRQGDRLLLGDQALAQLKDRPSTSFRSRRLWRETDIKLISVRVENLEGGEKFKLVKGDKGWTMDPKPGFEIDNEKVDEWVQRFQDFAPADIARDNPTPEDKKEMLLVKPSYQVSLEYKHPNDQAGMWTLTFGQDRAEDVFVYSATRPTVYKTTRLAIEKIRVPLSFFRDGRKPFEFPLELVRRVEIRAPGFSHTFKKVDSSWTIDGDTAKLELDQDKFVQFIQNVRMLEAEDFPGGSGAGLKEPQVRLFNEAGETIFALTWGNEYKGTFRFVKTDRDPEVVGVPKEKLDRLIDEKMVKEKR